MIKILLWDDKNKCYIERQLTREFLLKQIGLSESGKNITMMGNILKSLVANGFIKRKKITHVKEINGESIVKTNYIYELTTDDEWFKYYKKL